MAGSAGERVVTFCADDLGASPGVNEGILAACDEGPIRRASVLATGRALAEAARAAADREDRLEIGFHFSLTAGPALTRAGRSLGSTPGGLLRRALLGGLDREKARAELEAQWERLGEAGFTPTYLDGHHHVHLLPGLAEAAADFARDKGLRRIRLVGEPLVLPPRRRLLARLLLNRLSRRAAPLFTAAGLPVKERSLGLGLWQVPSFRTALVRLVRTLPPGRWEIFTHPRRVDGEFARLDPQAGRGGDPGPGELAALTDPSLAGELGEAFPR